MQMDQLITTLNAVQMVRNRRVIAIVGAPASGKSTLADQLAARLHNACVLPMDGFHRDNDDLKSHGLLARKGAPETFDVAGFGAVIDAVRDGGDVTFPTFDRTQDRVEPDGGHLTAADQTILVEGNYLLLDKAPWLALAKAWDFSVMIDVPLPVLRNRLVQRWIHYGHSPQEALARAQSNDLPNAATVIDNSLPADLTVTGLSDTP